MAAQDSETSRSLVRQAEIALEQAQLTDPAGRASLLLDAAILFAQGGDIAQSRQTLKLISTTNLSDTFFVEYSLLGLELDLFSFKLDSAREWLGQPRFVTVRSALGINFQRRILRLESALNAARGDAIASIDNHIQLAALFNSRKIGDQKLIAAVHDKIWQQLNELPFQQLQRTELGDTGVLAGWFELAASMRYRQASPAAQKSLFEVWQKRWRDHPAATIPPSVLKNRSRDNPPKSIALLLPLQQEYEIPSSTVLDGFMSGYYENLAQGRAVPSVAIYDTSSRPVSDVYNQAIDLGAEMVIGPLRQSQVEELVSAPELRVPTLTLNRLDTQLANSPDNLVQFGLSALDEVNQLADQAWLQGHSNVLIISPDSGWGERAQRHFVDYWNAKGGVVIDAITYPSSINDFTRLLQRPLEIDLSEQRGLALRRSVNRSLSYTPRRRQDIDLVIVLGYSEKVRQIKPALDFLYAADVPVYATSHIYSGTQQIELNRDLSGIKFSAMSWTLDGHMPRPINPDQRLPTAYRQLYALGYDAFLLHALLGELNNPQAVPVFGATGLLTLRDGVIERREKWATFENGRVIATQP